MFMLHHRLARACVLGLLVSEKSGLNLSAPDDPPQKRAT